MKGSILQKSHTDAALNYIEYVPSGSEAKGLPLAIFLHGRGSDAKDLAELAPALDGGYHFLFPDAPRPFEIFRNYSQGFTWFDGLPPTAESIRQSRELLVKFIGEMTERYGTELGRTVLGGFSQGGMMSIDVGFRLPSPLAGIVVMSGATFESDLPPIGERATTPVLVIHGVDDDVIPVNAARRTRAILSEHGIEAEYEEFPMGHWVTPESIAVVKKFLGVRLR
jgi:phospholipase/carboxylesterase